MSNSLGFKRAFILCPHADDGELWCGGTIARLIEEKCKVMYVAFSSPKLESGKTDRITIKQMGKATKILGLEYITAFNFPARKLHDTRQKILDAMIELNKELVPDVVFTPSINDIHQDHGVIASEALRAFRDCTILSYETVRNDLSFNHSMIVQITRGQLDKKIAAIAEYKSQTFRPYFTSDFIYSLARVRGTQIGVNFAEAFEVIKWIVK